MSSENESPKEPRKEKNNHSEQLQEKPDTDETLNKMKTFLDLLLKEIDKDEKNSAVKDKS
jgi:hypothetical protein